MKGSTSTAPRHYEYRVLTLQRTTSRAEAKALLTEQAEYGRWISGGDDAETREVRLARVRARLLPA